LRQGFIYLQYFFRIACFELEEYETALASFHKGASLDPSDSSFKTWIRKCQAEIESTFVLFSYEFF